MKKVAISVGDLNGVGLEILLRSHKEVTKLCDPIYCINKTVLQQAAHLLDIPLDPTICTTHLAGEVIIQPGSTQADSGQYSFDSFLQAIELAQTNQVDAIVTLPINKEAWSLANIAYKGHTDYLRDHFKQEAIMMLGCDDLYVALFTEHIPLNEVIRSLDLDKLRRFLINFYHATHFEEVAVLGVNPHAGDGGVLGNEETIIIQAIDQANQELDKKIFFGPVVPDTAFTPMSLKNCNRIVAMYHDQGLAPLKALYFDHSINVSLHLPIIRTSVDHGTAFDIAYLNKSPKTLSYMNAIKAAVNNFSHKTETS